MFRTFDHTADLGLHIEARSLEELMAEAGRALTSVLVGEVSSVQPRESRSYFVPGSEPELLLFDWLTELLYVFDTEQFVGSEFAVQRSAAGLEITARGEPIDPARHRLEHEVKAITYHHLSVAVSPEGYVAEVIVDI